MYISPLFPSIQWGTTISEIDRNTTKTYAHNIAINEWLCGVAAYAWPTVGNYPIIKSLIAFRRVASQAMEYTLLLFEMSIGIAINMFAEICKLIVRL